MFLKFLEAAHLIRQKLQAFDKTVLTTCKLNFRLFQFEVKTLFNYEMELKNCCIKILERDHWRDPDVDGRIILRWVFRKWEGVVGTEWSGLGIGTGSGHF
jgi:hypothetical protein